MRNETSPTGVGQQYAAAHDAHYGTKDLRQALALYRGIVAAHPDTQESEYSLSQIQNIVNAVVPKQELFDAAVDLASHHLEDEGQPSPRSN